MSRSLLLLAVLLSGEAGALEKCVGANGKITYSDSPCAAGATRGQVGADTSLGSAQVEYYDVPAPGGHSAHTTWNLGYNFQSHRTAAGRCIVGSLTTKLDLKVRMPRWSGRDPDLSARWSRYVGALQVHEAGHLKIARDFESAFQRAASGLTTQDCGNLDAALRSQFDTMLKQANQRERDYDAQTEHGATQGAVFK